MSIMLYATYGRLGVDMMQSVFREMGLRQDDTSVLMVREALATLAQDHPVKSHLAIAPDLGYDAGLVDTFLHGRERNYTIDQCLELVASAGLIFQDLLFKAPYHPLALSTNPFHARVSALPKERQWAIMEKINFRNGCHFFMACKSERAPSDYKIDFTQERALDYIPSLRHRCSLDGPLLRRHDWSMSLNENQQTLVALVDGQRSIRDILQALHVNNKASWRQILSVEKYAVAEFRLLWQLDFMAMSFSS